MDFISSLFNINALSASLILVCITSVLGLMLGQIKVGGFSLGIGGVMFMGLIISQLSVIDVEMVGSEYWNNYQSSLDFMLQFGLVLFVYAIGIEVGPGFFSSLLKNGIKQNMVALYIILLGWGIVVLYVFFLGIEPPVGVGIYNGAITNAPGLAAGQEMIESLSSHSDRAQELVAMASIALAVTYPLGIAGNLFVISLLRVFFKINVEEHAKQFDTEFNYNKQSVEHLKYSLSVLNPMLNGLQIREIPSLSGRATPVAIKRGDTELLATLNTEIFLNDEIIFEVTALKRMKKMEVVFGCKGKRVGQKSDLVISKHTKWERLVVTNHELFKLGAIHSLREMGVVVSRVTRSGLELHASSSLKFQFGDIITVIGEQDCLKKVRAFVGNSNEKLRKIQPIPMFLGIGLGLLLGTLSLSLPGISAPLQLGLAGGPLIVALLLSRLGSFKALVWFMPPAANHALKEIGIIMFLAAVGLRSGSDLIHTLFSIRGLEWILLGVIVTVIPPLVVGSFALTRLKMNFLTVAGILAGSQTNPPGLTFANDMYTSKAQSLGFVTVYPLTMCMRIITPQILVLLTWGIYY